MSVKLTLDKVDLKKVGKGALIAGFGAALTYLLQYATNLDFGTLAPVAAALFSILGNGLQKFLANN